MGTFYEYHSGRHAALLNLDDVHHVRARDSGTSRSGVDTAVEFKDGTKVTLPGNDVEHMRQMSQPIVPAAPGLYVVRFFFWEETPSGPPSWPFPACASRFSPGAAARFGRRPSSSTHTRLHPTTERVQSFTRLALSTSPAVRTGRTSTLGRSTSASVGPSGAKRKNPPRERGRRSMSGVLTSVPCAASVKETDRIESLGPMRPAGRVCM
jgi:hypothetical protein